MYPELLKIGPITIYSFGLMMGIAFIVGNYLLTKELKRKGLNPNLATTITLIALVAGIIGAKINYLLENFRYFLLDPIGMTFSAAGLTWYGGFLLATAMIYFYTRRKKISFWRIADSATPGVAWGYGIARIGCHLAGDGCYGIPTDLPWGVCYARGTYPPSEAFRNVPEIASQFPDGIVPDTTPLHPTPIYEFLLATGIFLLLWKLRKRKEPDGVLFMYYLILAGIARFAIEFIRINPRILLGLSEAQLISAVLIVAGFFGLRYFRRERPSIE